MQKTLFNIRPHSCIWMQAGVVQKKFCRTDYNCITCRFDKTMRRTADENRKIREQGNTPKGKRGRIVLWIERLKELPSGKRPCIHHMKGRINFRPCTNEYMCCNCEFDQYFDDQYAVHATIKSVDFLNIAGFKVPQGFYLHKGHAWARIEEDSEVRIGLDDFALRMLGPLDSIEAPLIGKEVKQNHPDILMSRGYNKARVLSPVSGIVTSINPKLRDEGSVAYKNPYSEGWIARIHSTNLRHDLKNLMIGGEAKFFYEKEVDRLYEVIEEKVGPLAADGGYLCDDIFGNISEIGWDMLIKLFLHT